MTSVLHEQPLLPHIVIQALNHRQADPCIFTGDRVLTYAEVRDRTSQMVQAMQSVGVRQGSTIGAAGGLSGPIPPCTGKWQRVSLTVTAQSGTFVSRPATVTAYVALYDPVEDHDVIVEDSETVRL